MTAALSGLARADSLSMVARFRPMTGTVTRYRKLSRHAFIASWNSSLRRVSSRRCCGGRLVVAALDGFLLALLQIADEERYLGQSGLRLFDESGHIGTEHVLLGLLRDEEGLAGRELAALGVTLTEVRPFLEQVVLPDPTKRGRRGKSAPPPGPCPYRSASSWAKVSAFLACSVNRSNGYMRGPPSTAEEGGRPRRRSCARAAA